MATLFALVFRVVIRRTRCDCLKVIYARLITGERYNEAAQSGICFGIIQCQGNVPGEQFGWIDIVIGWNW
jgi:hypothetical protein